MNSFKSPLFWRLLIGFCTVNLLVLLLGGFLTRRFIEYSTIQEVNWTELAQAANQAYESGGAIALDDWARQQRQDGIEATLYEDGRALREIRLLPSIRRSLPVWLGEQRDIVLKPWPGYEVVVQQVSGSDGHRQLVASSSARARLPPHARQQVLLAVQLGLSLLLIGAAGWWIARSVARPVKALRDATQRMTAGEFSARVSRRWSAKHDELGQLARDFNAMAERTETLITHDRGVLQDLSHELRSPLARLQLILDLAQHSTHASEAAAHFQHAEREIGRLDRLTAEMLALSRLEGGLPGIERERLNLGELVAERLHAAQVEAGARGIQMQMSDVASVTVTGNAMLLERALDNLIANAIKFSPEHGVVEVRLQAAHGQATVSIRDHGPGVPPDELTLLFRPFFRGSNAARADGHGLGLAIAQRVAQVHGGDMGAKNAEGGGLEVQFRMPV
ncbi:HAMP domain-containing sensor histidine kinase [Dyella tabacisoli]|uniref:histidine kinase n=1 Tax=Dyella tabacisoli TaxID=2282381 RepID=A0A369UYF9_9GAMM|nr:HAMP domain-containing sensor histidine kinase [Dyella tabacisoli]RDD83379.1 sensor histidine kinase [Dyella tabacisoli]